VVIPHQANLNLLRALGKRLGIADEKIIVNLDCYGNTSGASAFLALWQAAREGRLQREGYALVVAFGAGFTWGAALCRLQKAGRWKS
jgi:3-oxoacyl-[acyl-carrier-protein] synthase-3